MATLPASLYRRTARAVEAFLHADTADGDLLSGARPATAPHDGWGDLEARRFRYALAWGLYQNTAYRDLHSWAKRFRETFGLYHAIRNVYNPVDRLVEFHCTHVYGGPWDPEAGDGSETPSAAPIVGDAATPALRRAIARVWRDSLWPQVAEGWVRYGALVGDAPVKVAVDQRRGKVLLELVHPKHFKHVDFDAAGHVRGYVSERAMPDPRGTRPRPGQAVAASKLVAYEEHCYREGEDVVFETYLIDGGAARLWNWSDDPDAPAEWRVPYGFVPLVWTRYVDLGLGFGLAEYHTARPKVVEADDQASKLNDQIRKVVEPKWLFSGLRRPTVDDRGRSRLDLGAHYRNGADDAQDAARDEEGAIYARDAAARAQALVADLQIADALENVRSLLEEIERGFPELRFDRLRAGGEVSGEALRVARQPAETKINRRRSRLDVDLVRLHQMAVAIGGYTFRETRDPRFEDFAGFGLDSYAAGLLDHAIGPRPVFGEDPFELAALRRAKYEAVQVAVSAGIPRRVAYREAGYTDEQIDEFEEIADAEAERAAEKAAAFRKAAGFDNSNPDDQGDDVPPPGEQDAGEPS